MVDQSLPGYKAGQPKQGEHAEHFDVHHRALKGHQSIACQELGLLAGMGAAYGGVGQTAGPTWPYHGGWHVASHGTLPRQER